MADRIRSFIGTGQRVQSSPSNDQVLQAVLTKSASRAYHLTGYRMGMSKRVTVIAADFSDTRVLALSTFLMSGTTTAISSLDVRQSNPPLIPLTRRGVIDVLGGRSQSEFITAAGVMGSPNLNLDSGWVVCDLWIPELSLNGYSDNIGGTTTPWQMWLVYEYTISKVSDERMIAINQNWGIGSRDADFVF